ncbi:hypothetical protein OQA88_981 [Cercophora sp. LCS_1]
MRFVTALFAAAVASALELKAPETVPGAYIVEYEDDVDTNSFVNSIDDASLRKELRFKLFKGASIQFSDAEQAEKAVMRVAASPKVKNVWPVKRYASPQHIVHSTGNAALAAAPLLKKRQANETDLFTTHLMTQVNKLRDAGVTGKGIKIGVVDTGIDWGHPALGGCFGRNCLVSYGRDLVGDGYNGQNTPVPDNDPTDNCNGHGTHVAGIIAAQNNNPYGIIGGAQGVELGAYRVFGCQGDVSNDVLIDAYLQAYEAGSDIITASIGGPSGWADDGWATVVSRIVANGVPCVVSAGNDGSSGLFYASTAANGRGVTAIGSVDNTLAPALLSNASYTVDNAPASYGFTPSGDFDTWAPVTLPLWSVNFDVSDPSNGCDPYPASTPSLQGKIVLVRRGNCTFAQKVQNAINKGAKHVLVYNNIAGTTSITAPVTGAMAVAMVTSQQGATWVKDLEAGKNVVVTLPNPQTAPKVIANFENAETPGFVSTFSSWGPTFEVDLKPQFSAPGGLILSTYPRALGSYGVLSGTSMSCPLVAAIYALVINVRGTKDPKTLENVLSATSRQILFKAGAGSANSSLLAPVPQQGAGIVQAYDAAYATTLLNTSSLSFQDTDFFQGTKQFTISNTGTKDITYTLGNNGAATGYTFSAAGGLPATFPMQLVEQYATLKFSTERFTIPAGQRKIITVTVTPPSGLDATRLPVYSGYITILGSDSSTPLALPYIGVIGSLKSVKTLLPDGGWIARSTDSTNARIGNNETFTLPAPGFANTTQTRTGIPRVVFRLNFGSRLVRADVVPLSNCSSVAKKTTVVLGTKTIGQVEEFPGLWNPRNPAGDVARQTWTGLLADGTYAPAGKYKIVLKALRVNGNENNADDYDVAETQSFKITYAAAPAGKRRSVRIKGRTAGQK